MPKTSQALVSRLRGLRREREIRDREGVFVAEGLHLAREAVLSGASIELVVCSPRLGSTEEGASVRELLEEGSAPIHECSDTVLESLQDARSPQPVLVLVRRDEKDLEKALAALQPARLLLVAHGVQDPGNLGALVRTADAAGATGVVTVDGADRYHPRAVRATMGSIFRLPTFAASMDRLSPLLRTHGWIAVGASPRGEIAHDRFDWSRPIALVLGSEGRGIPHAIDDTLDATVTIAMRDGVESLSVSAAAAVLLFEAARSRGLSGPSRSGG